MFMEYLVARDAKTGLYEKLPLLEIFFQIKLIMKY